MMNLEIEKPILSIDAKNSVCYTEFQTQKILIYEFYIQKASLPEDSDTISEERACYFYSVSYQSDELYLMILFR